jgi:putative intracellular protease/amidase
MAETITRLCVVIFPGFALLDVAGPMQFFNQLSAIRPFELSIIAKTTDPVSTISPKNTVPERKCEHIGEQWLPTHTFDNAPELDIFLVPGGLGVRHETIFNDVGSFIKKQCPTLKYLLSVCTGSTIVAFLRPLVKFFKKKSCFLIVEKRHFSLKNTKKVDFFV